MAYDRDKGLKYETIAGSHASRANGRTSIDIECPFCHEEFTAYVWSLTGGGKKCPKCGALHTGWGNAYPVKS